MTHFSRFMIALSLLAPSLSFADQLWDHQFTPQAELELILNQSSDGDCPRTITLETNAANEIHMRADGTFVRPVAAGHAFINDRHKR